MTGDLLSKKSEGYYFDYFVSALFFFSSTVLVLNILRYFSIDPNYLALLTYIICTFIGIISLKLLIKRTGKYGSKQVIVYAIIIAAFSELMLSFVYSIFFSPILTFTPTITAALILILIKIISKK